MLQSREKQQEVAQSACSIQPSTVSRPDESVPLLSLASNSGSSGEKDRTLETYISHLYDHDSSEEDDEMNLKDDLFEVSSAIRNYKDKQPLDTNVIEYWYKKRFSDPKLSELALILHAIPATQVSVERCFSTLRFILSDYRTNIKSDTLADLMLLKLNTLYNHIVPQH